MKSLEELEETVHPTDKHWVLPGAVQASANVLLTGTPEAIKLVASEIAIAATTFTKFMGTIDPLFSARTLYITDDTFTAANNLRKLLKGRYLLKSPEDLKIVHLPSPVTKEFYEPINKQIQDTKTKLIIISTDSVKSLKDLWLDTSQGVTTVVATDEPQQWNMWPPREVKISLQTTWDTIKNTISISLHGHTTPITTARIWVTKGGILFTPA